MKNRFILIFNIILLISIQAANSQQWNTLLGNTITGTEYLGGDGTSTVPLRLKTITNFPINFYTNNSANPTMSHLTNGDLDVTTSTCRYLINSYPILWHNGIIRNIYLGVGAGNVNNTHSNTFVGYNTGLNNGNSALLLRHGSRNTFVGHQAGMKNDMGEENTFVGDSCGYNNLGTGGDGYHNTFLGASAGFSNISGKSSVYIGFEAGYNNNYNYNTMTGRAAGRNSFGEGNSFYGKDAGQSVIGLGNCFFGSHAGDNAVNNTHNSAFGLNAGRYSEGSGNCFFGLNSGHASNFSWVGTNNCFFGSESGKGINIQGTTTLNHAGGFGYKAIATSDYKIIIGTNEIYQNQIHVGIGLSNDQTIHLGPRSPLEINADPFSTAIPTNPSAGSGLQFRQLTSLSPTGTNSPTYFQPYGKVLTVDQDGIVKLTDDLSGISYDLCPNIPDLRGDIGMRLQDFRIYYEGNGLSDYPYDMKDAIGLGYACSTALPGKLSVDQTYDRQDVNVETIAGYFHNGDGTNEASSAIVRRSVYSICDGFASNGHGPASWNLRNIGGDFEAGNSEIGNIAVRGLTGVVRDRIENFNVGGLFRGRNAEIDNIGVWASSDGSGVGVNYGIYAEAPRGNCANGGPCTDAAGYFNGDVFTTSAYFISDALLKNNIQPLQNSMSVINALNPKRYDFRVNQFPFINLPNGFQDGLIAQEVQTVLPELVRSFKLPPREDSLGNFDTTGTNTSFLAINYIQIIPYLIGAVKEQQENIDSLNQKLSDLQDQINGCCTSSGHLLKSKNVNLSDPTTIVLNQNSPNPFSEETYITFNIPANVTKAMILIYDKTGNVLKSVVIEERGEGNLHVFAEKLSSGIYSYSLVADGVTVDTKQMICTK